MAHKRILITGVCGLSIGQRIFLGDKEDMDLILDAIRKVRANTDELRNGR